jgi:hypothetical protein
MSRTWNINTSDPHGATLGAPQRSESCHFPKSLLILVNVLILAGLLKYESIWESQSLAPESVALSLTGRERVNIRFAG